MAEGRADIAAIDAVTWRGIARWDAAAAQLRVLARTDPTPGLALAAPRGADAGPLRAAVAEAVDGLSADDRNTLGLHGIVAIPAQDYLAVPVPAASLGRAGGSVGSRAGFCVANPPLCRVTRGSTSASRACQSPPCPNPRPSSR